MKTRMISIIFLTVVFCVFMTTWVIAARFSDSGIYVICTDNLDAIKAKYEGTANEKSAVFGHATDNTTNNLKTYGVYGRSEAPLGIGVMGEANTALNPNALGVVSQGNAKVYGNLTVTGDIIEKQNVARISGVGVQIVMWDSNGNEIPAGDFEMFSSSYDKMNLLDDVFGYWDIGEWASRGVRPRWNDQTSWIGARLTFPDGVRIDKIVTYFRPNPVDHILDMWLDVIYRDGTGFSRHLGESTFAGLGKEASIPAEYRGRPVQSVLLKITDAVSGILNVGLAEIQCWGGTD